MSDKAPAVEEPKRAATRKESTEGAKEPPLEGVAAHGEEDAGLRSQIEASREERDELFRKLQYLQAEFENFRKRNARETETVLRFAHETLAARLLPVLDDFDAALANVKDDAATGVRMVRDNLLKALREAGLTEIPALGETFDPYLHDCVQQEPDAGLQDGTVKAVVRKGYRFHERVLRPAQVIVVNNRGETHG